MVFASYNSTSYLLPLDNDQSVAFYRNENRLFPTASAPSAGGLPPPPGRPISATAASSMSTTDMLTAAYHHELQHQHVGAGGASGGSITAGDCPFGRVQSPATPHQSQQPGVQHRFGAATMCKDFQPVGYLNGSSNGYYGFVPSLAPTGGGAGDGGGHNSNHRPATTAASFDGNANVNGHLSSPAVHFHGNREHISGDSEQNNNNNNGEPCGPFEPHPFSFVQFQRKRKDTDLHAPEEAEEDMDTNHGQPAVGAHQHPKRRKTDPEPPAGYAFSGAATAGTAPFHHVVQIHHSPVVEMECQDQPDQHPAVHAPGPNGFHASAEQQTSTDAAGQAASKSKYFDSSRCMMSHMI